MYIINCVCPCKRKAVNQKLARSLPIKNNMQIIQVAESCTYRVLKEFIVDVCHINTI